MTDYYNTAEAALIAFLKTQLADPYFPNADLQVTASNDEILSNGNDYYAVAYPGNFPISGTEVSSTQIQYEWEILLDLLVRWNKSTAIVWSTFKPYRDAVIQIINHTKAGKTLDRTNYVRNAVIQAEDRPRYIPMRGADPDNPTFTHLGQVCIVTVTMNVPRNNA